ncbi:CYTH domain-containing protein [Paracoccus sp. (in: a-proteobacteria)]|uniref:CYTH domain-containing protein n=1 Tax=Paracoccus sp. TaxID=267 RepID=UPI00396C7862
MAVEIERKFLVLCDAWRDQTIACHHIRDHLIARFESGKARIRICDDTATLTLKGNRKGVSRSEFHVSLSHAEAAAMIDEFAGTPAIEKRRYDVPFQGLTWQVDEYLGRLSGLVTSDVELPSENHCFTCPTWAGSDITHDTRYSSGTLARLVQGGGAELDALLAEIRYACPAC